MKKTIKTLALAAIASMFSVASVNAAEPTLPTGKKSFDVGMYRIVNTMNMRLMVEKTEGSSIEVRLRNSRNEVVYSEFSGKKSTIYAKKFNLEGLEDGKYSFEVMNGKEKVVKEFELSTQKPTVTDFRSIDLK